MLKREILVDANIVIDILTACPEWGKWSREKIQKHGTSGTLFVNQIILAELLFGETAGSELDVALNALGIKRKPFPFSAAMPAARAYTKYKSRGGRKTGVLPDFFIGSHAETENLSVLTRDPKRFQSYFPGVKLITP